MILESKLHLPQSKPDALLRTNLIELIKNNLDKKLILVTADAGYGKTTLLAQLAKAAALPCVYYDVDASDCDLSVFYSYLVEAIRKVDPALVKYSEELVKQGGDIGKNVELYFGTLINELYEKRKEELFIILDDYQNLAEDSLVHKALDYFIDHQPETVHVIVASRSSVRFPNYAKWFAKQDAFEVVRGDLCFSESEVNELLAKAYSQTLSDEELKTVLKHTEGWITGIQLILSNIRGNGQKKTVKEALYGFLANAPSATAHKGLFEYFASEIFSTEAQPAKDFMVKTSILELIAPDVCDYILGTADSRKMLEDLEKRSLFISLAGENEYKYHQLFRDFLQAQIPDRDDKKRLHAMAAGYFQKKKMPEPAIEHYLEAEEYKEAAANILNVASEMGESGRFNILNSWLRRLPMTSFEKEPELWVCRGIAYRVEGRFPEAEAAYASAEREIKLRLARGEKGKEDRLTLSGALLSRGRLYAVTGQQAKAISNLGQALRYCPASASDQKLIILIPLGLAYQSIGDFKKSQFCLNRAVKIARLGHDDKELTTAEANLAFLHYIRGDNKLAFELYQSLHQRRGDKYFWGVGMLWGNAVNVALIRGEVDWAARCLEKSLAVCSGYPADLQSKAALSNGCGLLCLQRSQWDQALAHFEQARREFEELGWKNGAVAALIHLACLCRCRQDAAKARQHLDQAKEKAARENVVTAIRIGIERSLADVSCGQFDGIDEKTDEILKRARTIGCRREEFLVLLCRASLWIGLGQEGRALRLLSRAVKMAESLGYDGLLIRELKNNPDLADLAGRCRAEKKYLDLLRSQMTAPESGTEASAGFKVQLFGNLRLLGADGREIPIQWRSRKAASLMAYLLLHRSRLCEKEELMKAFWPEAKSRQAEHSLHAWISRLKKDLGLGLKRAGWTGLPADEIIRHQVGGYQFSPSLSCQVDAEYFLSLYQDAKYLETRGDSDESQEKYQSCVQLYRDGFLLDLGERWCEEYRIKYEKAYLYCLLKRAAFCSQKSSHQDAVIFYRKYLSTAPYSDEVRMKLWKSLQILGRKLEIRRDYEEYKNILKDDMAEKAGQEINNFYLEIMKI